MLSAPSRARAGSILAAVLKTKPPIAVIIAARDLQTWSRPGQHKRFEDLQETFARADEALSHRLLPSVAFAQVELLPLAPPASAALLDESLADRQELSPDERGLVEARGGGNPAFLLAIARQLPPSATAKPLRRSQSGLRRKRDAAMLPDVSGGDGWEAPSSMKEVVLATLDRLPLEQQLVLKMASVLGGRVDREALGEIYPGSPAELDAALHTHGLRSYLSAEGGAGGGGGAAARFYVFQSPAVQEIIYSLMLLTQRQARPASAPQPPAPWPRRPGAADTM